MKGKKTKIIGLLGCLLFNILIIQAQTKTITGIITDKEENQPLLGVNVLVKGTSTGTITDFDGNYSVKASVGDILVVSYIGMIEQEVPVGNQNIINVALEPDMNNLEEVIVIGYGTYKKADIVGAVSTVKTEEVTQAPVANLEEALQGRMAGVRITNFNNEPGGEVDILIRGGTSLGGNNAPLYVVDGFPLGTTEVGSTINPEDIETIQVLKDASSTAIYGARGANGVILITTKSGKEGKASIDYKHVSGMQGIVSGYPEMLNLAEFASYQYDVKPGAFTNREEFIANYLSDKEEVNWIDRIFRTALFRNNDISVSGGNSETKYRASLSFINQGGVIKNSNAKRVTGRINLAQKVGDKLELKLNASYSLKESEGANNGEPDRLFQRILETPPFVPDNYFGSIFDEDEDDITFKNPEVQLFAIKSVRRSKNLNVSANIIYELAKGLTAEVQLGNIETDTEQRTVSLPTEIGGVALATNGQVRIRNDKKRRWVNENLLRYNTVFNKKHNLTALLGNSQQSETVDRVTVTNRNFPILNESIINNIGLGTNALSPSSLYRKETLQSYFGRLDYNFKSKYYITATYRADGASQFAEGNKWAYFPSIAGSWRLSNEPFIKNISAISNMKLRVSFGNTGNLRINPYDSFAILSPNRFGINNEIVSAAVPVTLGNKGLKWETTRQLDIGFELGLYKNKIQLEADYYKKKTTDLLLDANISAHSGFGRVFENIGSIQNEGLEFSISTKNINNKNFSWTTNFNISFNRNKVLDLARGQESFFISRSLSGGGTENSLERIQAYIVKRGFPVGSMFGYVWDGIYNYDSFDRTGPNSYTVKQNIPVPLRGAQPGDIRYKDLNGDGIISSADRTVIGNSNPIHFGGIMNRFKYKNLELSAFFEWSYGNDVLNAARYQLEKLDSRRNQYTTVKNRFVPRVEDENGVLIDPGFTDTEFFGAGGNQDLFYSDRVIEDGSYLRLKTLNLSYSFSKELLQKINLSSASVFVGAQNLWTLTNYSGADPDANTDRAADRGLIKGVDRGAYPTSTTISAGIRIKY
ncbi:TonB-dependent receptor [Tamlana sp. 2201CG12-4]|uniref:SusC/RagA family TonB-linked outer membrane protein n=1 Tax=Tamlana sp. 2201CG12-4 TaxID=3112582 RepID=UPI002DBB004A|nr:TonB-dependent receptor [Tamlana sp. 2201CG12-4]MEC3908816.1 TonB-dependent receptor [Tamlana sp. 2201CG12-4]